jgi:hypothetical protein
LTRIAVLGSVAVITLFTFTIGVVAINLRERDPSKLSSSLSSIITTMVIFGYLLLVVLALAIPFDQFFQARLTNGAVDMRLFDLVRNGIVAVSVVLVLILWRVAEARFSRKDV